MPQVKLSIFYHNSLEKSNTESHILLYYMNFLSIGVYKRQAARPFPDKKREKPGIMPGFSTTNVQTTKIFILRPHNQLPQVHHVGYRQRSAAVQIPGRQLIRRGSAFHN